MDKNPVLFIFNASISSGCDYVVQTIRLVAKQSPTYGIAMGDIISLREYIFNKNIWITKTIEGTTIIRPVSLLPGLRFRIIRNSTYKITAFIVRIFLAIRYPQKKKTVWFFEPFHIPELLWIFTGYTSIYDCVDYYPAFSSYAKKTHEMLVRKVTFVFANSYALQKKLKELRPDTVLVPLGFARELFTSVYTKQIKNNTIIVGYVGSISARLDFQLLMGVVRLMPHVGFVFVGPFEKDVYGKKDTSREDFRKLQLYQNVEWIQEVPKNKIPDIISGFDICMIPYVTSNTFNRYSFPMKVMEYFSLGKPVISTRIEELKRFSDMVKIGDSTNEWVREIKELSFGTWPAGLKKAQQLVCLINSWENKISEIIKYSNI